jgi:hypothetical protein
VNIEVDKMLDTCWELFNTYFSKPEVSIKQELVNRFWPEEVGHKEREITSAETAVDAEEVVKE